MKRLFNIMLCTMLIVSGSISVYAEDEESETEIEETPIVETIEETEDIEETEISQEVEIEEGAPIEDVVEVSDEVLPEETTEEIDDSQPIDENQLDESVIEDDSENEVTETIPSTEEDEDPQHSAYFRNKTDYSYFEGGSIDFQNLSHAERFLEYDKQLGIEVSDLQGSSIDWNQIKSRGIQFAMIRVGYRGYKTGALKEDKYYKQNITNALSVGLEVGVFFQSAALNSEEAQEEAEFVLERIQSETISLPTYVNIDWNQDSENREFREGISSQDITNCVNVFCRKMLNSGYQAGLYASQDTLENHINIAQIEGQYDVWVAHHGEQIEYAGNYGMWQYGAALFDGAASSIPTCVRYIKSKQNSPQRRIKKAVLSTRKTEETFTNLESSEKLTYRSKVQNIGWQEAVKEKELSGTTKRGLRIEAIQIALPKELAAKGNISVETHVQELGWLKPVKNGEMSGSTVGGRRLEAIKISLSDNLAKDYNIYYRVHVQSIGWQDWKSNGAIAGTTNKGLRIEAIEIYLDEKIHIEPIIQKITYRGHVENVGWQSDTQLNSVIGTTNRGLRLEAIDFKVPEELKKYGDILVQTHVQNIGWKTITAGKELAGSQNLGYRLEGIKITLTGKLKDNYDVFYRAHVIEYGWLGWASNGTLAGSEKCGRRIEAVQIALYPKGATNAPSISKSYTTVPYVEPKKFVQYEPTYYRQTDSRWSSQRFGNFTFGNTGCSPTSMAMAINGILKNGVTPFDVGKYLYNNTLEFNRVGVGSTGLAKPYAAQHWGLKTTGINSYNGLVDCLNKGYIVVIAVGAGNFVGGNATHAIVLFKNSNGTTQVYDPLSPHKNGSYSIQSIWNQRSRDASDNKGGFVGYGVYK